MSVNKQIPDYDLEETLVVSAPAQLRALADPLRATVLELLLERAASVTELAQAVDRPKSTVAYHVNLLVDAGLLRVVRTRRVRAIQERYYGRVAAHPIPVSGGRTGAAPTCRRRPPRWPAAAPTAGRPRPPARSRRRTPR